MTRNRSKRILGMTLTQLVILACMGCALISLFGGGAWMIANGMGVTFSSWPTPVITSTHTPYLTLTPSLTFTITPRPSRTPTLTPVPYKAYVPADWKQYDDGRVEIWLPETFAIVGDSDALQQEIVNQYKTIGLEELTTQREKEMRSFELLFRHGPPLGSHYIPLVFVKEYGRNGRTLTQFVDQTIQALDITSTLVERGPFEFYQAEGERVVIQTNFSNAYVNFVYYLRMDGDTIWEIGCDAYLIDSYTFQPTFDSIARTFRPAQKP
jgi:hypothetical protein